MLLRRLPFLLLLIWLLAWSLRLALTADLNHDDLEHLHSAWLMDQGLMPYLDFFQKQGPLLWGGLGGLFALPMASAGGVLLLARVATWLMLLASCLALYRIGLDATHSRRLAFLAPALLLASSKLVYNLVVLRPDSFMLPLWLWSLYFGLLALKAPRRRLLLASGFLGGLAGVVLIKALPFVLLCGLALMVVPGSTWCRLRRGLFFGGAALVPLLAFAAFLASRGLLAGFWFTNLEFNSFLYTSATPFDPPPLETLTAILTGLLESEPWVPGLLLAAPLLVWLRGPKRTHRGEWLLLAQAALGLLLLIPNRLPFYTYLLPSLLALLAILPCFLQELGKRLEPYRLTLQGPRLNRKLALAHLLALALALPVLHLAYQSSLDFPNNQAQLQALLQTPLSPAPPLPASPFLPQASGYLWDNQDRYLHALKELDAKNQLPQWLKEKF
jgi:hypothetical protein